MDYITFYLTSIVSLIVFAICLGLIAWHNRSVAGMQWLAGSLILILVKLVLQGLEGHVPMIGRMVSNEINLVSFVMQLVGLRWFVIRKPIESRWLFYAVCAVLVAYTALFLGHVPYSYNLINIAAISTSSATAWMLWRHGREPFRTVSRVSAAVLCAESIVAGYRAVLTILHYMHRWEPLQTHTDPHWLYSLAAMFFLITCMVMCNLWFLVTELNRELARQARTDPLTGALNRLAMGEAALRETTRCIRHGFPMCMIVLDIDHFKKINDTRGHAAGDCALQAVVEQVRSMLRSNDVLARTGGEEFALLLPDTLLAGGVMTAERIRQAVESLETQFEGDPIRLTVSAGVAQLDPSLGDWEEMMCRADAALYEAKEHGRNAISGAAEAFVSKPLVHPNEQVRFLLV